MSIIQSRTPKNNDLGSVVQNNSQINGGDEIMTSSLNSSIMPLSGAELASFNEPMPSRKESTPEGKMKGFKNLKAAVYMDDR